MVLYKRKPVQFVPPPSLSDDQEIWIIEKTGEIFSNYDDYLTRIDYYKQRRFICEITGHSGLDFFTALEKEQEASNEVNYAFPDQLREPILRKVQHSTIPRIDNLVDTIYEEFKQDFFPGEEVMVVLEGHDKMPGVVREKSRFNELHREDGTLERAAWVRYFVSLTNQPDHEAIVDNEHIVRDRKVFSKQMLRSFLKNSLHREAWSGAPWQVKERLAHEYRINTTIPEHLRYETQIALRKLVGSRRSGSGEYGGTILHFQLPSKNGLPELKPKSSKTKLSTQDTSRLRQEQFLEYQKVVSENPSFSGSRQPAASVNDPQFIKFINQNPNFAAASSRAIPAPKEPPLPPVKYPREDLELDISDNVRPPLKFLSGQAATSSRTNGASGQAIHTETVGNLLETWNTLNVYCEVFLLDSFTFDDYVEALSYPPTEFPSELLTEIHCAVLKKLVNGENDQNGRVWISLPTDEDSDDDDDEDSREPTPEPEPEPEKRTTRGSLRKSDAAALKAQLELEAKIHNGAEIEQCVKNYGWRARLRKRDFMDGRWVIIIVGLLNVYTADPRWRKPCEEILSKLAPPTMDANEDTPIIQYGEIDINLRVKIVQFLCMLSLGTASIKNYMDECTQQMTQYRKDKIEWQRQRKTYMEELKVLEEERRNLQPEAKSPVTELVELKQDYEELKDEIDKEEAKIQEPEPEDEDITMDDVDGEDEEPKPARSLRRANDRAAERRRRQEEDRRRKEEAKIEKANKPSKEAKQLEKLLKKIDNVKESIKECESEITICDNDLRESDCHRTRVLGKDRFWNRYYWFERNAMPYGGLPDSSTADAEYANGCIWVQGPDEMERLGFIDMPEADQSRYEKAYKMTVPNRKLKEEGDTHMFTAQQWGYYDNPEDLDLLIGWLNDKGIREVKLRKELNTQREQIVLRMRNREKYLNPKGTKRSDSPPVRISARTKASANGIRHRSARWTNQTARKENGHLHIEPQQIKRRGITKVVERAKKPAIVSIQEEGRQTRASHKQTRMPTRQGTRHSY